MKRFTKIISLALCLMLAIGLLSGISANAAPAKYNYAYFGTGFGYEYSVGDTVTIPVMLSSNANENQTFMVTVYNNRTGKTVAKYSGNFPNADGATLYNYVLNTAGWESGYYSVEVCNMQDETVLGTDYESFQLYEGFRKYVYNGSSDVVNNNLKTPHKAGEYLHIPFGSSSITMQVETVYYNEPAEDMAHWGNYDEYLAAPAGKVWVGFEMYLSNWNECGKQVNFEDFAPTLVDKNGKAIAVYSKGVGDYGYWKGTAYEDDSTYVYCPALLDTSAGLPYLRLNTSKNTYTYIDLNVKKDVHTLKQGADKEWYVYTNGALNTDFYGVVNANGNLWYAQDGKVDFSYTGIGYDNRDVLDTAYYVYVKNGKVDTSFNGFYDDGEDEWDSYYENYYLTNGVADEGFCGLVQKDGAFVAVNWGEISGYNGALPWGGTWWYLYDGAIDYSYTGFEYANDHKAYFKNGRLANNVSGLVMDPNYIYDYDETNIYRYVKNGIVDYDYDGLVYHAGGYYYVSEGYWQKFTDTMTEYGGTWYAVTNGRPAFGFTGFRSYYHDTIDEHRTYYFKDGKIAWNVSGLVYDKERSESWGEDYYRYVKNGIVDFDYDGLVYHAGGYYYVYNGRWQNNADGMVQYNGTWYALAKGRPDFTFTGFRSYYHENLEDWRTYYFEKGVINWSANGLKYYDYEPDDNNEGYWALVKSGMVDESYTGLYNQAGAWWYIDGGYLNTLETLVYHGKTWYYVNGGTVDFKCNTLVKYEGVWYYAKNGVVDWNTQTLVNYGGAWYAVKNGCVDWSYTGLYNYANQWFYVQNGSINWGSKTLVKYNGTYYYANGGKVDFKANTLVEYQGAWYYVKNSAVDFNYTGLFQFGGTWYYVKGGAVDFSADTLVQYGKNWYYVRNGCVDWSANKVVKFNGVNYNVVNGQVKF